MENPIVFGTYNAPSTSINLTASYTAPGILPKEMVENAIFTQEENKEEVPEKGTSFNNTPEGILLVPKSQ